MAREIGEKPGYFVVKVVKRKYSHVRSSEFKIFKKRLLIGGCFLPFLISALTKGLF